MFEHCSDAHRQTVVDMAQACAHHFRLDFPAWVMDNYEVYREFERRALRVASHRQHYSARTIAETIRHDTAIGELNGHWKINNNQVPDLARLFTLLNPQCSQLFEFRDHKAANCHQARAAA